MTIELSVALGAFAFNAATILLTVFSMKKKASGNYVQHIRDELELLQTKLEKCHESLKACEVKRRELEKREIDLMRQLIERGIKFEMLTKPKIKEVK